MTMTTTFTDDDAVAGLLRLDALISGTSGAVLLVALPWLDSLLGAPAGLLAAVGVFLLAYAAALVAIVRLGSPAGAGWAVVAGNTVWAVASVAVVLADTLTLTTTGAVVTLVQAAAVLLLADLQLLALRRR